MPKRKTKSSTMRGKSGTDSILSHERNWSELPEDIVHLFSKKLPDISDFICFRAVCKRWQLSAPVTDPPPQLPWLLEHRLQEHRGNGIIRFNFLSTGKVHTITCPHSRGTWLRGLRCRYLLAYLLRNSKRYLLNPLTRDQIHVPDAVNISLILCGAWLHGPDPIEGGDIVVMSNMMAFWRPKTDDWVYVEGVANLYTGNAYYMGQSFRSDIDSVDTT